MIYRNSVVSLQCPSVVSWWCSSVVSWWWSLFIQVAFRLLLDSWWPEYINGRKKKSKKWSGKRDSLRIDRPTWVLVLLKWVDQFGRKNKRGKRKTRKKGQLVRKAKRTKRRLWGQPRRNPSRLSGHFVSWREACMSSVLRALYTWRKWDPGSNPMAIVPLTCSWWMRLWSIVTHMAWGPNRMQAE